MWGCASIQVHMRRPEKKNGYPAWSVSSLFSEAGSFPEPGTHCWSDRLLSSKPNNPLSLPPATLGPQAHAAVSSFHAPIYFFYVYVCGFVHMHSGACRGQRGQISLEEELRTELWSSGRTVHALNHCALSSPCLASYGDAEVLNLGHACAGRILYPLSYLPVQHFFGRLSTSRLLTWTYSCSVLRKREVGTITNQSCSLQLKTLRHKQLVSCPHTQQTAKPVLDTDNLVCLRPGLLEKSGVFQ